MFKRISYFLILLLSFTLSAQKQVEVTDFFAKVYIAPSVNSKFIGLAQKGERYNVISGSGSWYRVDFKGASAWIEGPKIQIIDGSAASTTPSAAPEQLQNQQSSPQPTDTVTNAKAALPTADTSQTNTNQAASQATENIQSSTNDAQNAASSNQGDQKKQTVTRRNDTANQKIAQESRLRRWLSHQSLSRLPVIENNIEEKQQDKFFLVINPGSKVLLNLSPDSPLLGLANKGDQLKLIGEGDSWCKVVYQESSGWIEKRNGKVITSSSFYTILVQYGPALIIVAIFFLILVGVILMKLFRRRSNSSQNLAVKKNALIIAKETKTVQYTFSDITTTLEKCFSEIGFTIKNSNTIQSIKTNLDPLPDVVLIDWQFDRTILTLIERFFAPIPGSDSTLFIVYNAPDPSAMQPSYILPKMTFLGISFSDRDLFKLVTPYITPSDTTSMQIQKSSQSSALEGDIAGGNLIEVLQFIEIGRRTGCLLIDLGKPFGLVYFNQGRIIYAATSDGLLSRDALFAMLNLKNGKFRFVLNKKPKTPNTNLATLEILMEWTKTLDEAHRN